MVAVGKCAASRSLAVADELFAEEPHHARIEFAVERSSIEARRRVGANSRYRGCELRRARREESKVAGRHGVDLGVPGKAAADARCGRGIENSDPDLRSPELHWNPDCGQIVPGEGAAWRICDHGG